MVALVVGEDEGWLEMVKLAEKLRHIVPLLPWLFETEAYCTLTASVGRLTEAYCLATASVIREPRHIASVKKNSNYGSTRESNFFLAICLG